MLHPTFHGWLAALGKKKQGGGGVFVGG